MLVLICAVMWGRRHIANLSRDLEASSHRTRFNTSWLVERWDPEAPLRQQARELLRALDPQPGETVYLLRDDAKKAKRGIAMDVVAKLKDPTTDADIRGHHDVCAILVCREPGIPFGLRLDAKKEHGAGLKLPFRNTTEWAAQLIREFQAPAGVKGLVLFDAYDLCPHRRAGLS